MELNEYLSAKRERRAKRGRKFRIVFFITLGIIFIFGVVWLVAWSPVVRVNKIAVQGVVSATNDSVIAVANAAFAQSHGIFKFLGIKNILAWPSMISDE